MDKVLRPRLSLKPETTFVNVITLHENVKKEKKCGVNSQWTEGDHIFKRSLLIPVTMATNTATDTATDTDTARDMATDTARDTSRDTQLGVRLGMQFGIRIQLRIWLWITLQIRLLILLRILTSVPACSGSSRVLSAMKKEVHILWMELQLKIHNWRKLQVLHPHT